MATIDRRLPRSTDARRSRVRPDAGLRAKRAAIYVRMSLDKTGEGAGLDRQEQACRALALARGWEVVDVVDDTVSATKVRMAQRQGWQRIEAMIEAREVDVVIAWHLDRITRSTRDLDNLIDFVIKHDVGIATATGDIDLQGDAGRMIARILAAVAAGETERKAARQVLANEQRAAAGRPMWVRRPFGFERDGTLREAEAAALKEAYSDLLRGTSLSAIARKWDASGFQPTGTAATWGIATVRTILRHPRNVGLSTYYGEVVGQAMWAAVVDEGTWRAADRLLSDPARRPSSGPLANLLSGLASCDVCEGGVKVQWRGRKGEAGSYAIYSCIKGHASLPVEFADGVILWHLTKRASEIDVASFVAQDRPDIAPLRTEEAILRDRMAVLTEDYADGLIERAALQAGSARLRERLTEVEVQISAAGRADVWDYVDVEYLYEEFDGADLATQRAIVRAAFERISIKSRGRGRVPLSREHLGITWTPEWAER